jgi:hypothetical protein
MEEFDIPHLSGLGGIWAGLEVPWVNTGDSKKDDLGTFGQPEQHSKACWLMDMLREAFGEIWRSLSFLTSQALVVSRPSRECVGLSQNDSLSQAVTYTGAGAQTFA